VEQDLGRNTDEVLGGARGGLVAAIATAALAAAELIAFIAAQVREANERNERALQVARERAAAAYRRDRDLWQPAQQDEWWSKADVTAKAQAWRAASTWHQVDESAAAARSVIADRLAAEGVNIADRYARPDDLEWMRAALTWAQSDQGELELELGDTPALTPAEQQQLRTEALQAITLAERAVREAHEPPVVDQVRAGGGSVDRGQLAVAAEIVVSTQRATTTLLQRKMGIGIGDAERLMQALEERGIVGPADASNAAREVRVSSDEAEDVVAKIRDEAGLDVGAGVAESSVDPAAAAAEAEAQAARDEEFVVSLAALEAARTELATTDDPLGVVERISGDDAAPVLRTAMEQVGTDVRRQAHARVDLTERDAGVDGDPMTSVVRVALVDHLDRAAAGAAREHGADSAVVGDLRRIREEVAQAHDPVGTVARMSEQSQEARGAMVTVSERLRSQPPERTGPGRADQARQRSDAQAQRERMAAKVRQVWPEARASAVIGGKAWPHLADRLVRLEAERHPVEDVLGSVKARVENGRDPAALAIFHVKKYEESVPADPRMRAVSKGHPGTVQDAVAEAAKQRKGPQKSAAAKARRPRDVEKERAR
jgi:hypothetical protein